jgi:DNA (cytosine-5)-methyltransferase 1
MTGYRCLELCAGAGGQALGLDQAGFEHTALVDIDPYCVRTLRLNRPEWNVIHADIADWPRFLKPLPQVDLLAAGLPCPPFSVAGKQLGKKDERNLFPSALEIIDAVRPKTIMIENVRGFLDPIFKEYRSWVRGSLQDLGYWTDWKLLNACDFGVPQLRPRVVIVAISHCLNRSFEWPQPHAGSARTVGEEIFDLMAKNGWKGADEWRKQANRIAPTIVGGSSKHGGPDLGPTRARKAWAELGINGSTLAEEPPGKDFEGRPRLTIEMVARLQGFPDGWKFCGKKTRAYRQVGNAFPPPVARAVACQIVRCLKAEEKIKVAV